MVSRVQTFLVKEWSGGLNTADELAQLAPEELSVADNVLMLNSIAKKSRGGFNFFDYIAVGVSRSSSGTTRTIKCTLNSTEYLLVGDIISVVFSSSQNVNYQKERATIVSLDFQTDPGKCILTYTMPNSLTETTTADTSIRIGKWSSYKVINVKDFWYISANIKTQAFISINSNAEVFRYGVDGARTYVPIGTKEVTTITCDIKANFVTGDYVTIYTARDVEKIQLWWDLTGADALPAIGSHTRRIRVNINGLTSAADVATATAAALNLDKQFTASTSTADVIITTTRAGATTNATETATGITALSITTAGASLSITTPIAKAHTEVLGNKLIISFSGIGNKAWIYDGTNNIREIKNYDFAGTDVTSTNNAPDFEFMRVHQGRLWAADKVDLDKIHYSDIDEPERFNGEGDSGAIILASGDGDASGITAIFPPNKGRIVVGKGLQLWQIRGFAPDVFAEKISNGVGCAGHETATAIDQDDVAYMSLKGIHSLSATDQFGDFKGSFLSAKIQPTVDNIIKSDISSFNGLYVPFLNVILFSYRAASASIDKFFVYSLNNKGWSIWKSANEYFNCYSLGLINISGSLDLIVGNSTGRLFIYDSERDKDLINTSINYKVRSGYIYPTGDYTKINGYKSIGTIYKVKRAAPNFNIRTKIDDADFVSNNVSHDFYTGDILGSSFLLGSSELGSGEITLPENVIIDGYGYGIIVEIESSNEITLYGYSIDFEQAGDQIDISG